MYVEVRMDDTVGISRKKQRVCSQRQVHLTSRLGSAEVPCGRPLAGEEHAGAIGTRLP